MSTTLKPRVHLRRRPNRVDASQFRCLVHGDPYTPNSSAVANAWVQPYVRGRLCAYRYTPYESAAVIRASTHQRRLKNQRKRERMRREMWNKVEIG